MIKKYFLLIIFFVSHGLAAQTVDTKFWTVSNSDYSTDGAAYGMVPHGNTLYLSGYFNYIGPYTPYGAMISAATGAPLASPTIAGTSCSPYSNSCIPDGSGGFFISGSFTTVGGQWRQGVARINADGTLNPFHVDVSGGNVSTMIIIANRLYIGGNFTSVGGQYRSALAAIDIPTATVTSWNPGAVGSVLCMLPKGDTLFVGGGMYALGGAQRYNLGAVTVSTGDTLAWNPAPDGYVRGLEIIGNTLYAGGGFFTINNQNRGHLASFNFGLGGNGSLTSWNPDASGDVYGVKYINGKLYVYGEFSSVGNTIQSYVAELNPTTGIATSFNLNITGGIGVHAMSYDGAGKVYFGGLFSGASGVDRRNLASFDVGTGTLNSFASLTNGLVSTIASYGNSIFAGGQFTSVGGYKRSNLAAIDLATGKATSWAPTLNGSGVLAIAGNTVFVAGSFDSASGAARHGLAAFDINSGALRGWDPQANSGAEFISLATTGTNVYAAGHFTQVSGQTRHYLAAIDTGTGLPTSWNPNPDNYTSSTGIQNNLLYVSGAFQHIGGQARRYVAAIDLTTGLANSWNPTISNTYPTAFAFHDDVVYVGGGGVSFNNNGTTQSGIAAINANTGQLLPWSPASSNTYAIYDMQQRDGKVYIAGLATIGGSTSPLITIDTGTAAVGAWRPKITGSTGLFTEGNSVAVTDTLIFVSGSFGCVDSTYHPGLIAYRKAYPLSVKNESGAHSEKQNVILYPNPNNSGRLYLHFEQPVPNTNNYSYSICNMTGQEVKRGSFSTGIAEGIDVGSLNPGMYFIRASDETGKMVIKDQFIKE